MSGKKSNSDTCHISKDFLHLLIPFISPYKKTGGENPIKYAASLAAFEKKERQQFRCVLIFIYKNSE